MIRTLAVTLLFLHPAPADARTPVDTVALMPADAVARMLPDSVARTVAIDSVAVTARKPLLTIRLTGNIAVDVEQLKYAPLFAGEKDIFKFLQLMPGVSAGKDGMSGLLVRGGSNDQTQILYDDVPIYNQAHAYGLLSIFSGETVQSAEIAKGYISPAYGSRLSALTQIRTREGDRYRHGQSLTVGTLSLGATVDGPLVRGRGAYLVSGRYFFPEAALAVARRPVRFGFHDFTARLSYDVHRRHTLTLGAYTGDDRMRNADREASNRFGWGNTTASLRLHSRWSETLNSTAIVYYTFLYNRQQSRFHSDDVTNEGKTTFQTHELGARLTFDQRISDGYSLEYGANFSTQRFQPMHTRARVNGKRQETRYPSSELVSGALFVSNRLQWGRWRLDAGLRGALYAAGGKRAFACEPRAQLAHDFGQDRAVWLSATFNSQALVQFNRYYYSLPIDFWTPFRDGRLQRSWQVALGGRTRVGERLTLSLEGYLKRMRNLPLIYDSDDYLLDRGGFVYGTGRVFGIEAMAQWQNERLSLTASYTYTNSRRRSEGVTYPFDYDIPHDFNTFASYDVVHQPARGRRHTFTINVAWRSGLPYRLTNMAYPDPEGGTIFGITPHPTMRMRNYFRTDISYNMERRRHNGVRNWQFSIVNLTWHKNPVSIYPDHGRYRATVLIPILPSISYTRTFR